MNIQETIRKPVHPGKFLLEAYIKPMGLTVTESAKRLGISRQNLNDLIHEDISLSAEMALRIAEATDTSPESWSNMQNNLTMWYAFQHRPKNIIKFKSRVPA